MSWLFGDVVPVSKIVYGPSKKGPFLVEGKAPVKGSPTEDCRHCKRKQKREGTRDGRYQVKEKVLQPNRCCNSFTFYGYVFGTSSALLFIKRTAGSKEGSFRKT